MFICMPSRSKNKKYVYKIPQIKDTLKKEKLERNLFKNIYSCCNRDCLTPASV